jgi:precorrin-6B methylase 2
MSARRQRIWIAFTFAMIGASAAWAQTPPKEPYKPTVGQAGKDVVWVPTPPEVVEKMLDMAQVTPQDVVMDLGSGDGRNIIAAAKRGAIAVGVEYNPEMVELSRKQAAAAGVSDKATFIQGDMYEADISRASVLALFLLPHNLTKLTPKFLALKPGTRIVGNTFAPEGWTADETETVAGECVSWCTSLLWIVPARVEGTWKMANGELSLTQQFQVLSGTFASSGTSTPVSGKLRGDLISFTVGNAEYAGRVTGDTMEGTVKGGSGGSWSAARATTRIRPVSRSDSRRFQQPRSAIRTARSNVAQSGPNPSVRRPRSVLRSAG